MTEEDIKKRNLRIIDLHVNHGVTYKSLGERFSLSSYTLLKILKGPRNRKPKP